MRTLPIDVILPVVGRISKRSGTTSARERRSIQAMLYALAKQATADPRRWELLWDLKDGRRRLRDVHALWAQEQLDSLGPVGLETALEPAVEAWLEKFAASAKHHQAIRDSLRHLLAQRQRTVTIADLPRVLASYRELKADRPRMFNLARSHMRAFLRDKLGPEHPLAETVRAIPKLRERRQGKQGFAIDEARAKRDQLSAAAARAWWGMCLSGMNPAEYYASWEQLDDRVRIVGTKRPGRRWGQDAREVPRIGTLTRPEITRWGLTTALRKVGASPGQGRKTFARLLEDARVPRTRRRMYLGHGVKDVSDFYERYEVTEFLQADAERLRAALGREPLRMVK